MSIPFSKSLCIVFVFKVPVRLDRFSKIYIKIKEFMFLDVDKNKKVT